MWSLECAWRPSSSGMEDVAARVVEWCNQVGGLYPELSEWQFTEDSKRAALATPVVTERELARSLVADGGTASIWAPQGHLRVDVNADDYARRKNSFRFLAMGRSPANVDENDEDVAMVMAEMSCRIFSPEYVNCGNAKAEPMIDDDALVSAVNYARRDIYDSYPDFVRAARVIRTTAEGVFFARPEED
ncbi:hypothetical protein DMY01_11500 [Cutibacterium avidum]|uniref:Uncharacterized protein n=2 Tax=Cutibacterium avidum TaxID=33010 RepID=A0A3E2DA44_9ACTN|nr:hypothetical protein CHT91_11405 [Cutibacterium avidum]TMT45143.1 hypothetical protein DMY01_11500 [Cutibacterium avidum]